MTSRADRVLLVIWLPLWAVAFVDALGDPEPHGIFPVEVASAEHPAGFPVVTGQREWAGDVVEGIRPGDRLLSVGEHDLAGASAVDVFLLFSNAARGKPSLPIRFERAGRVVHTDAPANPASFFRVWFGVSLVHMLVAVLLIWRAPSSPMVRAFFQAFAAIAILFASPPDGIVSLAAGGAALGLACALSLIAFQRFPHGDAPRSRLWRLLPWTLLALAPLHTSRFGAPFPPSLAEPLAVIGVFANFAAILIVTTRNYRLADPIGRRQVRWVLFGCYLASLPPMFAAGGIAFDPAWTIDYAYYLSAIVFAPLAILISVIRYNLFDVDRLISAVASYNLLLLLAGAAGLAFMPDLADVLAERTPLDPRLSRTAIGVALVALLLPAHRALRPRIERIFFQERWNLDRGIEDLIAKLDAVGSMAEMTALLGGRLAELLRPEACVVYARGQRAFAPVFIHGRVAPSSIDAGSSLVGVLESERAPVDVERRGGRRPFAPYDRALLGTMGASLLVPVHTGSLIVFVCLGRKRSGDVYTPTDRAQLYRLTDHLASHLRDLDQEALLREGRAMQEKLRRYVPSAIVEQLSSGEVLDPCERDVSVLFVDMRGYTTLAEDLHPEEIFSTLNRYTEIVSELIVRQGGHVVEFNGDGMMAVFGAPDALPAKERSAVSAARAIVSALAAPEGSRPALAVSVGIASGDAYVGNMRSAERLIWSAVGNTTNLAARLQELSKEWDAAVVIDARTREAAGADGDDFELRGHTPIRGRRAREVVYALPARSGA